MGTEIKVGNYAILNQLGSGGNGTIYRVRSLSKYTFLNELANNPYVCYVWIVNDHIYAMKEIEQLDQNMLGPAL